MKLSEQYPDIPIVSPSQLRTFDGCEFAWDLSYRKGWKTTKRFQKMELGTMVGKLLNVWYETHSEDALTPLVNEWLAGDTDSFVMKNIAQASWLAKRYIHDVAKFQNHLMVLDIEHHFEVLLITPKGRKYILQGYIDLVVRDISDGSIWIWEHKTTGRFWSPIEAQMDLQLPSYAAALRHLGYDVMGICVNQINNYDYAKKEQVKPEQLFRQELTYRTPVELDNFLLQVGRTVDEMIDLPEIPRRRLKRDCKMCNFQEPCLMELKGVPIEDVLNVSFRKKDSFVNTLPTEIYLEF